MKAARDDARTEAFQLATGDIDPWWSDPSPGSWPLAIDGSATEDSPGTNWGSPIGWRRSTFAG